MEEAGANKWRLLDRFSVGDEERRTFRSVMVKETEIDAQSGRQKTVRTKACRNSGSIPLSVSRDFG